MEIIKNNKNKKREAMFIAFSSILLVAIISFIIYAMQFLISKTGVALESNNVEESKIPRINFDGLKKIGIMK
ncbi:MAG: hypothetical protein AAB940_01090 [Patescibacteria group bacterium]